MSERTLEVGQTLWYVPHQRYHGEPREVTVEKIGRKWATTGTGWDGVRINKETWGADGGQYSSPGQCYASKDAYEAERALDSAWDGLWRRLRDVARRPDHITREDIEDIRRILRIPAPPPKS